MEISMKLSWYVCIVFSFFSSNRLVVPGQLKVRRGTSVRLRTVCWRITPVRSLGSWPQRSFQAQSSCSRGWLYCSCWRLTGTLGNSPNLKGFHSASESQHSLSQMQSSLQKQTCPHICHYEQEVLVDLIYWASFFKKTQVIKAQDIWHRLHSFK